MIFKLGGKSFSWLYQRISAVFLAVTLWLHFHLFVKRFIASGGISYNDLMTRFSNPMFKLLEITFIFFAVSHGLNGIWSIIENFGPVHTHKRILSIFLWAIGISLFLFISTLIVLL